MAVIGDAYSGEEACEFNDAIRELRETAPNKTYVVVPKCEEAFEVFNDDVVLGYANGYSDVQAEDLGLQHYRGRDVHVLGSSPPKQYQVIQQLTQPNLRNDPPANIRGVDWNGAHKIAYLGEYWSADGWQPADHLSIRETVEESLKEIKNFWQEKDMWPEREPVDLYGPASKQPDDPVFAVSGRDLGSKENLETAIIKEDGDRTYAFESDTAQNYFEYRLDSK